MNGLFNARKKEYLKDSPISKAFSILKIAMILIIITILIITAVSLMEYSDILNQTENVDKEIVEAQDRVDELKYLIEMPRNDRSFIIRIAREKLGRSLPPWVPAQVRFLFFCFLTKSLFSFRMVPLCRITSTIIL